MKELKRKGARNIASIPIEIVNQLNYGSLETVNMVEWLAVDQLLLLKNILIDGDKFRYYSLFVDATEKLAKKSVTSLAKSIGEVTRQLDDPDWDEKLKNHPSDMARCWAAFSIGSDKRKPIEKQFDEIYFFANDPHFGVREVAWLSIRNTIIKQLDDSIQLLQKWALSPHENIRRFASEATRPRGVWSKHIDVLKSNPEKAIEIIEPLKEDPSKYVRDSVGNWLNDASKTQADFVIKCCNRWEKESNTEATQYIIKKALRTLKKQQSF